MSSIYEFIRRNRGKLLAGTVIAGGAYLAQKYYQHYADEERQRLETERGNLASAATAAFGVSPERMMLQNRRLYIFDSNHRTCDNSIVQLIPSIKTKLQKRFDLEELVDSLKQQQEEEPVDTDNDGTTKRTTKVDIWNRMKIDAVSRLLSAAVCYPILVVSLKTQISILAAQIYDHSAESQPETEYESWFSRMYHSLGGKMAPVKPEVGGAKKNIDVNVLRNTANIQQLFLQALQFFINKGVDSLNDTIQSIVSDHLRDYSLKDPLTLDQLRGLLGDLLTKVINFDASSDRHFSFYVVPMWQYGLFPDEPLLEELLFILKTVLESTEAQRVLSYGVDLFVDAAVRFIRNVHSEEYSRSNNNEEVVGGSSSSAAAAAVSATKNGVPLARLIPTLTDAFHEISRVNFDSVLSNYIISQQIHEYSTKVYAKDQNIW